MRLDHRSDVGGVCSNRRSCRRNSRQRGEDMRFEEVAMLWLACLNIMLTYSWSSRGNYAGVAVHGFLAIYCSVLYLRGEESHD